DQRKLVGGFALRAEKALVPIDAHRLMTNLVAPALGSTWKGPISSRMGIVCDPSERIRPYEA
ncbi:hypothetical protein ACOXVJ_03535, partial [Pseudomonas knackmussii]|uniref:hypothetical protein n=1 Tax=Pseudomonas knackmussii TaxID=65741 RepID=UPI003BCAAE54